MTAIIIGGLVISAILLVAALGILYGDPAKCPYKECPYCEERDYRRDRL